MIDTIKIFAPSELTDSNNPSWRASNYYNPVNDPHPEALGYISERSFSFADPKSGYRGFGERSEIRYHSVSLPRLLHGQNGRLIKNQDELDTALQLFQQKAGEVCAASFTNLHFTRVDLVWQFRGDTAGFILAHRNARHPRIRRGPSFYEARSMAFKGSEMRIAFYDKTLEQSKGIGDVVRVEVQLRGGRLQEELGNGHHVVKLDFDACYQAYRRIMMGFVPAAIPKVGTIAEFLALGERERWESGGIPAWEIYTRGMCRRQLDRLRRDMAAYRPEFFKIDWAQLLPADGPPAVVETKEFAG